ncbi:MAG: TSUP family transporter [Eubacteriales bacterium]|nr:TSUP family transporter [Eubacteriales bacterium]
MHITITQLLIICPLLFLAGFVDAIAGGGGLISLPAYMFAGLPVHACIATNKMSSSMGTTLATIRYAKSGFIPWKQAGFCVITAFIGSTAGARIALYIPDKGFKIFMMIALPVIAFHVLRPKTFRSDLKPYSDLHTTLIGCGTAFVIGLYDGFYGPGTGTFLLLLLTGLAHMELTKANGTTKVINLTTNVAALCVYLLNGKVMIPIGIIAGCFNIAGNYLGARTFEKGGAKPVKPVMLVVLVLFFLKIILEFFPLG